MPSHSHRSRRRSRRRPIVRRRDLARRRGPVAAEPFRIRVDRRARVALLHVTGELDLSAVSAVERALDRAVDRPTDDVVFDLRGVSFLDLAGLEIIIRADQRARSESFAVHVVRPPGLAARIFTLTAQGRALALVDDLP